MLNRGPLRRTPAAIHALDWRRQFSRLTPNQIQEHQLRGGQKPARLGVRLRGENAHANHDVRPNERFRWLECPPVKLERDLKIVGREMGSEDKGKSELSSETGAEIARPEKIERNVQAGAWDGHDRLPGRGRTEVRLQLQHVLRKSVAAAPERTAEGAGGELIAPRRATQTEIDAARIKRLERAELFGDDERRVVRKHYPASADADASRFSGDVSDDDRSGRAGDPRKVVMFREPVAMVSPLFCVLREIDRISKRQRRIAAIDDR